MAIDAGPTAAEMGLTQEDVAPQIDAPASPARSGRRLMDALKASQPQEDIQPSRTSGALSEHEASPIATTTEAVDAPPTDTLSDIHPDDSEPSTDDTDSSIFGEPKPKGTESSSDPVREQALEVAEKVFDGKIAEIKGKIESDPTYTSTMSDSELQLYSAYLYELGLPEGSYVTATKPEGKKIDGGKGVKISIAPGKEHTVTSLLSGRKVGEKPVYKARAIDPTDPSKTVDIDIDGSQLSSAYFTTHESNILSNFPEGPQRDLVSWALSRQEDATPVNENQLQEIQEALKNNSKGFPTEIVRGLIGAISPDASKHTPEIQKLLTSIEGKTVLTRQDYQEAIKLMGGSSEAFATRSDELSAEKIRLEGLLRGDPGNTTAAQRLEEIKAEQDIIGKTYSLFKEAEKEGKNPFDTFFDKAEADQLDLKQFDIIAKAMKTGDIKPLLDEYLNSQNFTEEEKHRILKYSKTAGKGALWILAMALVIPAVALAGATMVAASSTPRR